MVRRLGVPDRHTGFLPVSVTVGDLSRSSLQVESRKAPPRPAQLGGLSCGLGRGHPFHEERLIGSLFGSSPATATMAIMRIPVAAPGCGRRWPRGCGRCSDPSQWAPITPDTWPGRVVEVTYHRRTPWIVKTATTATTFDNEVHAYTQIGHGIVQPLPLRGALSLAASGRSQDSGPLSARVQPTDRQP